jgi:Tol biopolymer transport system component
LSPPGSSNTCGWFHPTKPGHVIFGSTVVPPQGIDQAEFQREGRDYKWAFPREMDIVMVDLSRADGTPQSLEKLVTNADAYLAECAIRQDGRYLVYCECPPAKAGARPDGNLRVMDLQTREIVARIDAPGYDGGPFFSPDGTRLCYRSDRRGDDLLQVFVAELEVDEGGAIRGVSREFQLTDNAHVNWAPFWHPGGRHMIYTTSQMGHDNYEVFLIDADAGDVKAGRPVKYGTGKRRITFAHGFDGLPVFNRDASLMMWTSQRDHSRSSQIWLAGFTLDVNAPGVTREERMEPQEVNPTEMHAEDRESGLIYIYDMQKHTLMAYDKSTHERRLVTDEAEKAHAMELFKNPRN